MSEIVTVNGGISDDFETENEPLTSTAPMSIQSCGGKWQALRVHFLEGIGHIGKRGRFSYWTIDRELNGIECQNFQAQNSTCQRKYFCK